MSETKEPTVSEEIELLREEAEAVDLGLPTPTQEQAAEQTPSGGEETEGESNEMGLTEEGDSEDEVEESAEVSEESETPEAEADGGDDGDDSSEGETSDAEPEPGTRRVEQKKAALKRSWENADKRHREADEREQLMRQRETELLQREQVVAGHEEAVPDDPLPKYSLDEIADSLEEFIDEGEFETAKGLIQNLAAKAKALQNASIKGGPGSTQFAETWEQVRGQVLNANPDLKDTKSSLYQAANGLLNGDWSSLFQSHPSGVAAAVEVAKLQVLASSSSELSDKVKRLEIENKKLKKATSLDGTSPTSRDAKPDRWDSMSLDDQMEALRADAVALS